MPYDVGKSITLHQNSFFPKFYFLFFISVIAFWLSYMFLNNGFLLFTKHWLITITMVFGSFIAGASSEGGGAIAFPVFTLLLDVTPQIARNFSFAIQSIGMTAASVIILELKIPIERKTIVYASLGGVVGLLIGTFGIIHFFSSIQTKLFFVSLWLSFGIILFLINRKKKRTLFNKIENLTRKESIVLIFFGFLGGIITAFFGNGIDILIFCLLTLYFKISEKVATPTSVIIMTINTIFGAVLHAFVIKDFQEVAFEFWVCSIPIVIIFAPLGAFVISSVSRHYISKFLYFIVLLQFIGAIIILKPSSYQYLFSLIVIIVGSLLFFSLMKKGDKRLLSNKYQKAS